MSIVRTVLGDVDPATLGAVDAHDHLFIVGGPATERDPDLRLDLEDEAQAELKAFRDAGGGTVVDALPAGCGRRPDLLRRASEATGVQVIATTGFHTLSYYEARHWARSASHRQVVEALLHECAEGITPDDREPVEGTPSTEVRPGLVKVATSYWAARPEEARWLRAVAEVHQRTGLPVLTHTEHGTFALEQLALLSEAGVDPESVIVSHLDRAPDPVVMLEIVEQGAHICIDGLFREKYRPLSDVVAALAALVDHGHAHQILLGGDIARRSLRRAAGAPGIAGVLTHLAPRLTKEFGPTVVEGFLIANPARALAFTPV
jgi:5-phospho-D-xylono-1,4-lactonase